MAVAAPERGSELVPGDPAAVRAHAAALTVQGDALLAVGSDLRAIDTGATWSGEAADAFHEAFRPHPARFLALGDAHHDAARAVSTYADVLAEARGRAAWSSESVSRADAATEAAPEGPGLIAGIGETLDTAAADAVNATASFLDAAVHNPWRSVRRWPAPCSPRAAPWSRWAAGCSTSDR